jgi:putative hemolysin
MSGLKAKLITSPAELEAAQRLRYEIFNLELRIGQKTSENTGLDQDEFDAICDHLIIIDENINQIVGTYRLLLDSAAEKHDGFYAEKRFDLNGIKAHLTDGHVMEVGRSCIRKEYRKRPVLNLLWQHIAKYCIEHQVRYLIGCPSITTQDPLKVSQYFVMLKNRGLVSDLGVRPIDEKHAITIDENIPVDDPKELYATLPPLFHGYMDMGAKVCGYPAVNMKFQTTIFFIVLDLMNLNPWYRKRFMKPYLTEKNDIADGTKIHAPL